MSNKVLAVKIIGSIVLGVTLSARALAADVQTFSGSGDFGVSFFESTDASGCILTDVSVSAGTGTVHLVPGGPDQAGGIDAAIVQFDRCRNVYLLTAAGGSPNISFQFARDLSSASASATVFVVDAITTNTFPISVSLGWTGLGASQHNAGAVQVNSPGGTNFVHTFNGTVRMAQATGVVSDGRQNFMPQPSLNGQLESIKDTQVTVTVN